MSLGICSLLMTEDDDADDEAQTSTDAQSRFAKFESPNNIYSEESTDDGDNNDDDDVLSAEDDTTTDLDSTVDTNTSASDLAEQATSDSRSSRVWSDAAITNTTDTDSNSDSESDSPEDTSLSGNNSGNSSDDISDSTASVDSNRYLSEPAPDSSQRDSDRMWNQLSHSDSPEKMRPTGNQVDDSSVNVDQTDDFEEITTDNDQTGENPVNPDQTNSPVNPQSQSPSSSLTDNTSTESIQSDSSTVSDGSQALLLGEDNSQTWNAGFNHILETQYPQNLLLLVPAGETIDILRVCQEHPSWDGGEIIIIKVGASVPGDMSVAELSGDGIDESIETHQISDQTDLSRLGILITQVLDNWQNPDQNTVCSVHTLQAFLQYLSPQKVFQFLYTLSRRLQSADIETTYLMTPSDGDRTINTLRPIFDTVIET